MASPKRFRLSFLNAAEDVPRLIRSYGRACFGEFALVLRPSEHRGAMVRLTKEGAWMWRAGENDAPALPTMTTSAKEAVALVKAEQKGLRKPGPITLRGQWSGYLYCEDGVPRVELTRKLATYGVLRLSSVQTGWNWAVERTETWFGQPGSDSGLASTLVAAIEAGLARAMGLLGEACSTRDSHRRAALDARWAKEHPVRPAKEGKDPTERLRPRQPRRTKAAPPPRMDAPVAVPDAPATPAGVQRMAKEVSQEADALASLREVSWVWQDSTVLQDAVTWFRGVGLEPLADDLTTYEGGPDHPPEQLLAHLRSHLVEIELDEETRRDAESVLGKLEGMFRSGPQVLERVRRLVRHAARLTESELCQGQDRKQAARAIERALSAYEEARAAVTQGAVGEARAQIRSTVEWAALAAAKAARACAMGQTTLLTPQESLPPSDPAPSASRPRRTRKTPQKAPEPSPPPTSSKRPRKARAVPAQEAEAAPRKETPQRPEVPSATEEKPGRKRATRKRTSKSAAQPEVDAAKDKLLLDAFKAAVSAALSEGEPA